MGKSQKLSHVLAVLALVISLLTPMATVQAARPLAADPNLLQLAADHPDGVFGVIVQRAVKNKDLPDEAPETAVENAGGKVKKQLTMIDSFSAELTGKEIGKLAKHPKVRWISLDAPLVSTAASDPTVRDDFNGVSYSNNDGTQTWADSWTETGGDGLPESGYIRIANGSLQLSYMNRALTRQVDLSQTASAKLSFQYKRSSLDNAYDYVAVEASSDGGATWTELARYQGPATDNFWRWATLDLAGFRAADTQIRFVTSPWLGAYDTLYVDYVQIQYAKYSRYAAAVRADQVWANGLTGQGVTVAVVDSGIADHPDLRTLDGASRIIAATNQTNMPDATDAYGHGTHVAGIIGGNGLLSGGMYSGVAPEVNLINVKVCNDQGAGLTSDLIDGLQWILDNRAAYNIKVVTLSLNAILAEPYQTSPLDAAVEILWFNGIVVVVAAGNNGTGSGPVTLYPPANDPFVITVGAAEDKGTAALSDDTLAFFSAYGTTEDGFAKPDLVAPGRYLVSLLASANANAYINHEANRVDGNYFRMSGTSMAAPVVAGAAALLLQGQPGLTPDQVKYRLMATANKSWPGYAANRAGAGYLDVYAAVKGTTTTSANTGLSASKMLWSGSGPINWNSVNWNSVNWNSVNWNSVNWNSVNWNSVNWNSDIW